MDPDLWAELVEASREATAAHVEVETCSEALKQAEERWRNAQRRHAAARAAVEDAARAEADGALDRQEVPA